jgi:hypothetical protein
VESVPVVLRNPPKPKSAEVLTLSEVRYPRHVVSPERKTTDPKKLKAIWEWTTPKNKYEIRSFLGLCTYYRWHTFILPTLQNQ